MQSVPPLPINKVCVIMNSEVKVNIERVFHRDSQSIQEVYTVPHPKMKISSILTHPQVVPNLYEFLS